MIELVILDVDGVMTDGKKYYCETGMPHMKTYCDKDFTAIKKLRASGIPVCFLSGDDFINKEMAKNRNIDFYSARGKDRASFVSQFEAKYKTKKENMLYVGDDLFDISIMKAVGHCYCPNDSCKEVKDVCGKDNILRSPGGHNVVMELVDLLCTSGQIKEASMKEIEKLDKKEKF